jgi:L-ascorbate metabolism protein UlaG (beta-lactamase superfamily)
VTSQPRIIYIDPWRASPKYPESEKIIEDADVILVTHGHFDHCTDAPLISQTTGASVVCSWELQSYMQANGAASIIALNKGGSIDLGYVEITMVSADHSGDTLEGGFNGGFPSGFILKFKDGSPTLYHAGDTNVFGDMKIISDLYAPQVACLPIGGVVTMSPREAAYAIKNFLFSVKTVLPMHYLTIPLLAGTPEQLVEFLDEPPKKSKVKVKNLVIGQAVPLNSLV